MTNSVPTVAHDQALSQGFADDLDPIIRFNDSLRLTSIELERRTDDELTHDGLHNPDPAVREHALYQLLARQGVEALPLVETALFEDQDPELRINVLWAIEKLPGERARELTLALASDKDTRVQEWARVFAWEMQWTQTDFRLAREAAHRPARTFDETLFLHINCDLYVRLSPKNDLWGHLLMSPRMLARVYGQALACPITQTRERRLVIAKTLKNLHEDGTDHYESFLFQGFTERPSATRGNFYFEAHARRPFYLSGRADDTSEGVIRDVMIPFAREGQWFLNPDIIVDGEPAIEYVRGRFQGWAYVNVERIQKHGGEFLFPGNSVLSTLHHPVAGMKTNTFLAGSFKGKLIDWDGDGILDLNYLPAHATADGEIDSDLDGVPDLPGATACIRALHA